MSNPESFISEVTEELRRDRLYRQFRKWAWLAVLLVVLVVGAAAWREWSATRHQTMAQEFGDSLRSLAAIADHEERAAAYADLYDGGAGADAIALARIHEAGLLLDDNQREAAINQLQVVVADDAVSLIYRDLALLKTLQFQDEQDEDATGRTLGELTMPGRPYRLLALEFEAMNHFDLGLRSEAIEVMESVLNDADVTPEQIGRITQFLTSIGHETENDSSEETDGESPGVQ
ncbi:MAG: hypothetical protein OXC91_13200 [Rhodobacteraceae bacterium]|nr:hypothetical protein [Paracoccaceae bacterium]